MTQPDHNEDHEAGSYSIELILLFPVALIIVVVIAQIGVFYSATAEAQNAADAGYYRARIIGGTPEDGVEQAQYRLTKTSSLKGAHVEVQRERDQVTVTVTGTTSALPPFLPEITITRQMQGPSEEALRG
ncbi:pilus assembly protein [Rothia mucilaginosa]|uniref:TadE family protein n=1 Tax=Rothia mucilaginosa TaxID=43675 RepID=UPI0028EDFF4A|nr:pilus assembly protein [Rothia mucilaginosa]